MADSKIIGCNTTNKNDFITSTNTLGKSSIKELYIDVNKIELNSKIKGLIPTLTTDKKPVCQILLSKSQLDQLRIYGRILTYTNLQRDGNELGCCLIFYLTRSY
jgi:hypothetical protein